MTAGPVAIVGAGLAGLRCAGLLAARGVEVEVYEASDGVGGRARTDTEGGFRLDRGFQVLLTAYPEARRALDFAALELGEFEPGAMIRSENGFSRFSDPLRRPRSAPAALRSPVGNLSDKRRLGWMRLDLLGRSPARILSRPDLSARESLEARGFSQGVIERFFRPFFGGVFIDPDLSTSSRMMEIFFRCFASGAAALPAGGMGSMAGQLASRIEPGTVKLGRRVVEVRSDGIRLEDGDWQAAAAVVVATEEREACRLLGTMPSAANRTTACVYFDAPESDINGRLVVLAPPGEGPVNELAVPSSVAPGYAPHGRSLVSVSAVGAEATREDLLEAVKSQLAGWFGDSTVKGWRHLATRKVEYALPDFQPGRFRIGGRSPKLGSGVFICGDHRESPSIQGALVSGRKAAEAIQETTSA
ncbi:MAG: FAD-dependent oxidoreductase [Thermoleophilia bacterium]|nr:FAD-dependent oxidoreductase [Thermoleophilia bacterium]